MRQVTASRWAWGLCGILTALVLAFPVARLIGSEGTPVDAVSVYPASIRTVTIEQPVTSVYVQTYGAPVRITAAGVRHVQAVETISYDLKAGGPPAVTQSVSGGRLTLNAPSCAYSDCNVSYDVTVPPDVTATVATEGGPITASGIAGGDLDSNGGPVRAARIGGPLTVITGGGSMLVDGAAGTLDADTDGGPAVARDLTAAAVQITAGGGSARVVFAAAPATVTVSTDGGPAMVTLPGGPYALMTESDGGPEAVGISTDPAASRKITVITNGGSLRIAPLAARLPRPPAPR